MQGTTMYLSHKWTSITANWILDIDREFAFFRLSLRNCVPSLCWFRNTSLPTARDVTDHVFVYFFRPESSKFLRLFDLSDTICAETLETRKKLKLSRRVNDIEPRIIKGHWPNFRRRRKKGNIPPQLVWHYCASIAFTDVWSMNGNDWKLAGKAAKWK